MATFRSAPFVALLLLLLVQTSASKDPEELKAKPQENVTLQCQGPRDAAIIILEWNRDDLERDVFCYRDGYSHEDNQHPSFRGRVQLRDPDMKDGNVSLILKNVSVNDTGTYKCRVLVNSKVPELINTINLTVTGHTAGNTWTEGHEDGGKRDEGDKDEGDKDGGNLGLSVGLPVAVVLLLAVIVIVCFVINRKRTSDRPVYYTAAVAQQA